jgi:aminoglycoside 6'-N-acetyltransferase
MEPDVARWWGSRAAAQAAVLTALDEDMGLCSIVLVAGQPVGYAQAIEIAGTTAADDGLAGCYKVDVFVAARAHRARGVGRAALEQVVAEVFTTTLAVAVVAVLPLAGEAAVRAHERAGFRWQRIVDDPLHGPCWLVRRERA